jgi:uncharacterized membrane protein
LALVKSEAHEIKHALCCVVFIVTPLNPMAKPHIPTADDAPSSYTWTWAGAAALTVVFGAVLALWPPDFGTQPEGYEAPTWLLFFGRFHPIAVHLPIGVLILSVLIEMGCLRRSVEDKWGDMALFTLFVAAVGGVVAVVFGIFLAREGGYEGGSFILHQGLGIATAVGAILALFLRLSAMSSGGSVAMIACRVVLLATMGVMSVGAHFGANMVHGSKYLTQYAPAAMASSMTSFEKWMLSLVEEKKAGKLVPEAPKTTAPVESGAGPATGDKLVFQHVILPMLEAKCNACHNADKSKGDLRMDTYELAIKGGENGSTIVPGKPVDSLAIQRIELPADDDEHMPPDGKDQATAEELALLKWWIQEGASDKLKVSEAKIPVELKAVVDAALKGVGSPL